LYLPANADALFCLILKSNPRVDLILMSPIRSKFYSLENNEVDFSLVSVLIPPLQIDKVELLFNELYMMINKKRHREASILEELKGFTGRKVPERNGKFIEKNNLNIPKKSRAYRNEGKTSCFG
jgi:hypothetical protein